MPKYFQFMVAGYYLYFTSFCVIERMYVHASDKKLTESGSAKFFVKADGATTLQHRGRLTDREALVIQKFIKKNYREMYLKWKEYSSEGFSKSKFLRCDPECRVSRFVAACGFDSALLREMLVPNEPQ